MIRNAGQTAAAAATFWLRVRMDIFGVVHTP
jgi:hypothetical protein